MEWEVKAMWQYLPIVVAILGLLTYALADDGKIKEIARIAFFAGLLVFLLQVAGPIRV
jgi:hypothetical protein